MPELHGPLIMVNPDKCFGCHTCEMACVVVHTRSGTLAGALLNREPLLPRDRVVQVGEAKLRAVAPAFGVKTDGRQKEEIAEEVARAALAEFGNQEGALQFTHRAPQKRQALWNTVGITPRGIDREVVEGMHRTTMGVDNDPVNLILHGLRTGRWLGGSCEREGRPRSTFPSFLSSAKTLPWLTDIRVGLGYSGGENQSSKENTHEHLSNSFHQE